MSGYVKAVGCLKGRAGHPSETPCCAWVSGDRLKNVCSSIIQVDVDSYFGLA